MLGRMPASIPWRGAVPAAAWCMHRRFHGTIVQEEACEPRHDGDGKTFCVQIESRAGLDAVFRVSKRSGSQGSKLSLVDSDFQWMQCQLNGCSGLPVGCTEVRQQRKHSWQEFD